VPALQSTQPTVTAVDVPRTGPPSSTAPAPTVMTPIAGAPQNWAITGSVACIFARAVGRNPSTAHAAVSATSRTEARPQTTVAQTRRPGNWIGRLAAATPTMPVPMIGAYQSGPMSK